MTCLEKYLECHPTADRHTVLNERCPDWDFDVTPPDYCDQCDNDCEMCWNRLIPGTEGKTLADAFVQAGASAVKTGNAIQKLAEAAKDFPPYIKDSGSRHEFESGAVRDIQEGKGRCDLMPMDVVAQLLGGRNDDASFDAVLDVIDQFRQTGDVEHLYYALEKFAQVMCGGICSMLLEVSKHFEEGAKKYGEHNWQKGIPVKSFINSAIRHYLKWLRGDKDEPHDRAFCWNIMCAIWTCKHKPELNGYAEKEKK